MQKNYFRLFILTLLLFSNPILTAMDGESLLSDDLKKNIMIAAGTFVISNIFNNLLLNKIRCEKEIIVHHNTERTLQLAKQELTLIKECEDGLEWHHNISQNTPSTTGDFRLLPEKALKTLNYVENDLKVLEELKNQGESLQYNGSYHRFSNPPSEEETSCSELLLKDRASVEEQTQKTLQLYKTILQDLIKITETRTKIKELLIKDMQGADSFEKAKIDLNVIRAYLFLSSLSRSYNSFFIPFLGANVLLGGYAIFDIYKKHQTLLNKTKEVAVYQKTLCQHTSPSLLDFCACTPLPDSKLNLDALSKILPLQEDINKIILGYLEVYAPEDYVKKLKEHLDIKEENRKKVKELFKKELELNSAKVNHKGDISIAARESLLLSAFGATMFCLMKPWILDIYGDWVRGY